MKNILTSLLFVLVSLTAWAQGSAFDQLKADPKKAYGNDYPYQPQGTGLTKAPKGYKPFYISHYARHGSRYYWNDQLYNDLDNLKLELVKRTVKKIIVLLKIKKIGME